jgi:hypothetical protein
VKALDTTCFQVVENVDEESFAEAAKKKAYHFAALEETDVTEVILDKCLICGDEFEGEESDICDKEIARCLYCKTIYHMFCLASSCLGDRMELIPKNVKCLVCERMYNWNEFITNE